VTGELSEEGRHVSALIKSVLRVIHLDTILHSMDPRFRKDDNSTFGRIPLNL